MGRDDDLDRRKAALRPRPRADTAQESDETLPADVGSAAVDSTDFPTSSGMRRSDSRSGLAALVRAIAQEAAAEGPWDDKTALDERVAPLRGISSRAALPRAVSGRSWSAIARDLAQPLPVNPTDPGAVEQETLHQGVRFGRYTLLGKIAGLGEKDPVETQLGYREPLPGEQRRSCRLIRLSAWAARDERLRVAFNAAARTMSRLRHPGIASLLEAGELDGIPFAAIELIDGLSLTEIRAAKPSFRMPLALVLEIGVAIADALAMIHGASGSEGLPLGVAHLSSTLGS